MVSQTYTSVQFDDPLSVVEDLVQDLPKVNPFETVGILLCDSQIDYGEVVAKLADRVNFPVVGGTVLAFPVLDDEDREISASFLVLSKPGLTYSIAVSEPLDIAHAKTLMTQVYERGRNDLGEDPRLIMPFFPLMPGVVTDHFASVLFEHAGQIPVFGGVTTNDLISTKAAVFSDGEALQNQMILLMLGGSIRPVFSACNVVTKMASYAPTVTKSKGSTVYMVDDMSFCEYMRTLGLPPEDRISGVDALMQYGPIPVEMHSKNKADDGVPEVRCISYTNLQDGCVTFSGLVDEGTKISVGVLHKEDVDASAAQCLDQLKARMAAVEKEGYHYSAMFCISCVARYFILVGGENTERTLIGKNKPADLPVAGYYAFCEIGPTLVEKENDRLVNRTHSASIIMCAL